MKRLLACLFVLTACAHESSARLVPRNEADQVALDTERVCGRRDAAGYTQIPVQSAKWRDLAVRADRRDPIDREALREIADLMRANRKRFSDSRCTKEWISNLEKSALTDRGAE